MHTGVEIGKMLDIVLRSPTALYAAGEFVATHRAQLEILHNAWVAALALPGKRWEKGIHKPFADLANFVLEKNGLPFKYVITTGTTFRKQYVFLDIFFTE